MDGLDLTRYQEDDEEKAKIAKIVGKVLSGRSDYEALVEKKEKIVRCASCDWVLKGGEKFCPECGAKV
jgi:hypothetical protein